MPPCSLHSATRGSSWALHSQVTVICLATLSICVVLCRGFLGRVRQGFSHIGHGVLGTAGTFVEVSKQQHYQLAAAGIAVTLVGAAAYGLSGRTGSSKSRR